MSTTIRSIIIIVAVLISLTLSIFPVSTMDTSDARISCIGPMISTNKASTPTDWVVTVISISGSDHLATNSTYLAVWTADGRLTIVPTTLDSFTSNSSIDPRVEYLPVSYGRSYISVGDVLTFDRAAFAQGLTARLLRIDYEEWGSWMSQISFENANTSQLDPLPAPPRDYLPSILAILLVIMTVVSIFFVEMRWQKYAKAENPEERSIAFTNWMQRIFIIGGISLSILGLLIFPLNSSDMTIYRHPSLGLLFFVIVIVAPILSWFAASYEYSKRKLEVATSLSFRSYLLLSLAVSIISFFTFTWYFFGAVGGTTGC